MRIEIDSLEEFGGRFSKVYQADELPLGENDLRLASPVTVAGQIRRDKNEIDLTGKLDVQLETICSRCLKPLTLPVHAEFDERFSSAIAWRNEAQHELTSEDLNLAMFSGEAIDLDELAREQILLAVPGQPLCDENCQGLCPICGVDRNLATCACERPETDTRWEKLKELQT